MKINVQLSVLLLACSALLFTGCKKEKEDEDKSTKLEENGLSEDINDIVSGEIISVLQDSLKMPIHRGGTPPDVEGIYELSETLLMSSNIPSDQGSLGQRFADARLKLYNQNDKELEIKLDMKQLSYSTGSTISVSEGNGSFISGEGSKFSIFVPLESEDYSTGEKALTVNVISGEISSDGIKDMYFALVMSDNDLDNNGDIGTYIINGGGRVFYDSDGMSESVSTFMQIPISSDLKDVKTITTK